MTRPVIGITTQTLPEVVGERQHCWIMGRSYIEALRKVGAIPWLIPLIPHDPETLEEIFQRLDGAFITGGIDVDPGRYGEERLSQCDKPDHDRDEVEIMLLRFALKKKLPVLAVCRGIQILNVTCGGSLYQDIQHQVPGALKHDYFPTPDNPDRAYRAHDVSIRAGTRLSAIVQDEIMTVNSMHHQAIKELGNHLQANAYSPDGVIEGIEGQNGQFLVAVQWHPEELTESDEANQKLFASFIAAAQEFAAVKER